LDARATEINEAMKVAAVHALAELAHDDVPDNKADAVPCEHLRWFNT
jgi:malate dehydrogenase (oxaloacetate-decarboxylating)(NADP+)